ncbi:uncharacterized protein TNCV_3655561 [Trichonephila clavipes]|nr:uncharacterized protein TNCV_3655561 [Trichonephila clavipes]
MWLPFKLEDPVIIVDACASNLNRRLLHHRSWPTRGLLATDHVILNHGQVTWTTPELAPPLLTTTPHQREDVSTLDRFNVHRCPTRRVFSGTRIELVTKQATIQYLYHSATKDHDYEERHVICCTEAALTTSKSALDISTVAIPSKEKFQKFL